MTYNLNQFSFKSGINHIFLGFENGDRSLLLSSTFTPVNTAVLAGIGGLFVGFGGAFAVFMGISKKKEGSR